MERAPQGSSQGLSEAGESVGPALEPSPSLSAWISDASGPGYASNFFVDDAGKRREGDDGGSPPEVGPNTTPAGPAGEVPDDATKQDADLDPYLIPKACEAALEGHAKAVSSLAVDRSGSRVLTGANDGQVHIYDFAGMKKDMRAFRKVSPTDGGHHVSALSWSPSGDCFLAVTTSAQASVFDRDGRSLGQTVRGDMYLMDVRKTKGHTAGLTCGQWHPTDRDACVTSSEDGTLRVWDVESLVQKTVIKPSLGKPGRVSATSCAFNDTGSLVAGGMMDGTIQLWSAAGKAAAKTGKPGAKLPAWKLKVQEKQRWSYNSRPGQTARGAHSEGSEITGLCFSGDGHTLFSRGADETFKVWDLRKFGKPVKSFEGLPCNYASTGCAMSPDQQLVLTGVSSDQAGNGGALLFFDTSSLDLVRTIPFSRSVTAAEWHPKLNQLFVGTGDKSFGEAKILYDPELSERGALVCASRAVPRRDALGLNAKPVIYAPNALPMFQENWSKKRERERDLKDPKRTKRPDPGSHLAGRGRDGKVGASQKSILTQHLLETQGQLRGLGDPREALEKYADGKSGIILNAYQKTQPKPIFQEDSEEEEEEGGQEGGPERSARKVDPATGMYV